MALIPPLIIVIGVPNAIFLINKYQQEVKKHGNQAKSLQRVISKIGNATLMTNITTASASSLPPYLRIFPRPSLTLFPHSEKYGEGVWLQNKGERRKTGRNRPKGKKQE